MLTSYHVHTKRSDGKTSARELAEGAVLQHLDELGISDHYVLLAGGKSASWSIPLDDLPAYFEELRETEEEFRDRLVIRYGLEADFDPFSIKELADTLKDYSFDYIIGSIHYVDGFPIDESAKLWENLSEEERNDVIRTYWVRVKELAESGLYDFVGHLDLYKKYGYRPTVDMSTVIAEALDAVAAAKIAVEINTAGWYKAVNEAYPSLELLLECRKRGIPLLINADAHEPAHLTRDYDRAKSLAREAGYRQVVTYEKRITSLVDLS